jgi:hypothetical protein
MKQLVFLIFILILSDIELTGQHITIPVDSIKYSYCEIFTEDVGLGGRVTIEINYGQGSKPYSETRYKSPLYSPVFSAIIDALNYMGKNGWEVIQVYAVLITSSSNTYSYHYLLKKRIS